MTDPQATPYRAPRREPLARASYQSGYAIAGLFLVAGIAGIVARFDGLAALAQPLRDWPALRAMTSVVMLSVGVALFSFLRRRYTVAVAASTVGAGLALLAMVAYFVAIALPYGGISLASAVALFTASLSLLLASARRRLLREEAAIGVAGFVLLAFTTTFIIARAAALIDPMSDRLVAGAAVQVIVACFLLGACFVALVWTRGLLAGESARWLPAALGVAGAITVVVLWRALATREMDQLHSLTQQAGEERGRVVVREADVAARALHRAAEWRATGAPLAQQRRDVEAMRRDVPGLEAAGWISAHGVVDTAASAALGGVGADSVTLAYVTKHGRLPDSVAYLALDSGAERFVIVAPACDGARCKGAMIAVLHTAELFRAVLPDTSRGYGFGITGRAGFLAGSPISAAAEPGWTQWLALPLGATHLTLTAWPTLNMIGRVRSELPALVLLMGLVVSALVTISASLGQRSARGAREAERSRLTSALERTTDGIWEWDITTGASVHSPGIWRYLGYDPASVPATRAAWLALVHPDDAERLQHQIDDYLSGARASFEAEYRVLARDASWHTIVDRGRIVDRSPSGVPQQMLGIKADVTVTRVAQQARDAAQLRFREIFDSGFQFQLLLDGGGVVLEVNQHALDAAGVLAGDVRGRQLWDTLWWDGHADAQDRLRSAIAAAFRGKGQQYEDEFRDAGDAPIHLEIAVKRFLDEAGAPTQLLVEARDLTAHRRAEATLREVETLTTMGRVAARVAHEINNPLAGIQNSFLLIKGAIPTDHPHYSYVGAIEREIGRIAAVTRQLYETYRPEQDESGETSVATVIGDAVAFLEQVNRASNVKVVVELSHRPSVITLPSVMLRQIAYNLVQNAIEASPPGETVHVRTLVREGRFVMRVRDLGPGVPDEAREKVFEPFFSTKKGRLRTGGMGLGLALVRRTVHAAGGTIVIEDVEGGGCEFVVALPLSVSEKGASQ